MSKKNINLAESFYDNLFEMAPLIKPMFKTDRKTVERHFYEMVSIAVNQIDHFEELRPSLIELGRRHFELSVKINQFSIVKSAFMLSIQYHLKEKCTESLEAAWSKYIDIISEAMIEGLSV